MPVENCIEHQIGARCSSREMDWAISELAGRQHGVVARWQLLGLGMERRGVQRRLEAGRLRSLHVGVYAVGHQALTVESRWVAAVLAGGPNAVLSYRTAGQLWGIFPRSGAVPEITRPKTFRPRPGIRAHRVALSPDEIEVENGIPVTSASRTQLDLAAVLSRRQMERVLNEAQVLGLTSRLSLPHLLERYPGRRGNAILRELLSDKEPGGITRNDFEERFVAFLDANGLPRPRFNATISLRGQFFEADCLWESQRLMVELDSRAVHGTDRAFERDRRRDRIVLAEGWRSTRITWRQLRDEPEEIAADLRLSLATAT
jgi:very-short-patch-repair endonuclease